MQARSSHVSGATRVSMWCRPCCHVLGSVFPPPRTLKSGHGNRSARVAVAVQIQQPYVSDQVSATCLTLKYSHTAYSTTACSLEGRTSAPPPVSGAQLNPSLGFSTTTATATHSLLTGTDQAPPAKPFAFGRRGAKRSSQLLLTQAKKWMRGGPRTMARRRHGGRHSPVVAASAGASRIWEPRVVATELSDQVRAHLQARRQ
jgi:hypothetical protein